MDLQEEIRFRVTNINFTRVTKTANGTVTIPPSVSLLRLSTLHSL